MKTIGAAVVFLLAAAALTFLSVRYGLGRLPGDLVIDRPTAGRLIAESPGASRLRCP